MSSTNAFLDVRLKEHQPKNKANKFWFDFVYLSGSGPELPHFFIYLHSLWEEVTDTIVIPTIKTE